ncbi:DUF3995 domain-containing protein [Deinococcus deserti]|uniref:DUF3995 domain-containing protein n=1 Tax=Deinococcus deserti (strain DSM 17065 / CIP 109153 / LMG 22923 / VCD115) TaxID=546414 RepID=C1CUJ5_DEIDV|nr:DUF3995 domain-containing protein [Deinococcus deserti]ACO45862.1 conserved hypothetical protein; putative membrane protein [Deinococcus deserti VCD115]
MEILIWPVVVVMLMVAGLHVAWGVGVTWPGRDARDLAQKVVGGSEGDPMPSPLACYAVAGALLVAAAALVLTLFPHGFQPPLRLLGFVTAGVFLLRGALGYVLPRLADTGQDFYRLNRVLYSPLCLALGGMTLLALLG